MGRNSELSSERDPETCFNRSPGSRQTGTGKGLFPWFSTQEDRRSFPKEARGRKQDHSEGLFRSKSGIDDPTHGQFSDSRRRVSHRTPGKEYREVKPPGSNALLQINGTFDLNIDFHRGMGARESRQNTRKNRFGKVLQQT